MTKQIEIYYAMVKLSDEIEKVLPFSSFTSAECRLAILHGIPCPAGTTQPLIAALQFVDFVSEKLEQNTTGTSDDDFAKFEPLIAARIDARNKLCEFVDVMRVYFDKRLPQISG